MAKKIKAFVKLALPAGKATPAPPVGPACGRHHCGANELWRQCSGRWRGGRCVVIKAAHRARAGHG